MSTGFAFKQSLHLRSVSNLRILLVCQLRSFKVGFSGPKTFRGFRETGPWFFSRLTRCNCLGCVISSVHSLRYVLLAFLSKWCILSVLQIEEYFEKKKLIGD